MTETPSPEAATAPEAPKPGAAVSKRLASLLAAFVLLQARRFGVDTETLNILLDLADFVIGAGVVTHWSAPAIRAALAKAKRERAKDVT